jgi:hypothetical protein
MFLVSRFSRRSLPVTPFKLRYWLEIELVYLLMMKKYIYIRGIVRAEALMAL